MPTMSYVVHVHQGPQTVTLPPLPRSPTPAKRVPSSSSRGGTSTTTTAAASSGAATATTATAAGAPGSSSNNTTASSFWSSGATGGPPSLEESSQSAASVDEDAIKTPRRKTPTNIFAETTAPSSSSNAPSNSSTSPKGGLPSIDTTLSPLAAAWNRVILTPPAVRRQQEQDTSTPNSSNSKYNQIFLDTMTGLKDAASGTYQGLKEWAKTPRSSSTPRDSSRRASGGESSSPSSRYSCDGTSAMRDTMDDMHVWYGKKSTTNHNGSPTNTTTKTNGRSTPTAAALVSTLQAPLPADGSHSPTKRRNSAPQSESLLQDLAWPFMACVSTTAAAGSGGSSLTRQPHTSSSSNHHKSKSGSSSFKEKDKDASHYNSSGKSFLQMMIQQHRSESFGGDESIVTLDTLLEEEHRQLQRLTSWGTAGTYGTIQTVESILTERTQTTYGSSMGGVVVDGRATPLEDDDGNVINPVLLEKAQKKRAHTKKSSRRKRLVKFDYPPISSLRECPRADPNELGNLFFTEEELEQMEEDRFSTLTADDVEIVAVGSPESDVSSVSPAASFSNYKASPRNLQKSTKGVDFDDAPASPTQVTGDDGDVGGGDGRSRPSKNHSSNPRHKRSATPRRPSAHSSGSSAGASSESHLIRGVQIYLRERSTPC